MFEIADRLLTAVDAGRRLAVATAISIEGSAPRTVGTSMAWDGESVIGSIAGGCVEGAVVEACELVLADGQSRTVEYGVSDETALSVGLTCGGQLRIHIRLLDQQLVDALKAGHPVASVVSGPGGFEHRIAAELAARSSSGLGVIDCDGELLEVFYEVPTDPPTMIIFGAMEFSAALSDAARMLGYRVTVCDPRSLFATAERFPGAEIVVAWPTEWLPTVPVDQRTVICVLSHDARFDAELIAQALATPAQYVGAMGSRRTHDRRVASLRERGVDERSILRLHSPIGLDLGASTVEETAISILAEVIASRTRSSAASLTRMQGDIHRPVLFGPAG
jgi:xanthine dehydrogenase accessory factor